MNILRSKKKYVIRDLNSILIKIGIPIVVVAIALFFFYIAKFNHSVIYGVERSVNYLSYATTNSQYQMMGKLFLDNFPINDWNSNPNYHVDQLSSRRSWKGQGASSEIVFKQQIFQQKTPVSPNIGSYKPSKGNIKHVFNPAEFLQAIESAQAGDTIELMPGEYLFNQNILVHQKGLSKSPITVRSSQLGLVKIKFNAVEGFHVFAPFWVFENLEIMGVCNNHYNECEHAFHVVGNAHSFVLRNNRIIDFNAALKVNRLWVNGKFSKPDHGLVEKNSFYNNSIRQTKNPVTLLNINNVSHWVVRSNYIADFSKGLSDNISYGTFMKGSGHNGIYENNLIICEHLLPADKGRRIGLSFGGGGTNQRLCGDDNCEIEHSNGIIRNNIILNCSHDVGLYLNKSNNTKIYNNLIFNSLGIDIQYKNSNAVIVNNIISGRIKAKNKATYTATNNYIDPDCIASDRQFSNCSFINWYQDIVNANTRLKNQGQEKILIHNQGLEINKDFCGHLVDPENSNIGPIQYRNKLNCSADYVEISQP